MSPDNPGPASFEPSLPSLVLFICWLHTKVKGFFLKAKRGPRTYAGPRAAGPGRGRGDSPECSLGMPEINGLTPNLKVLNLLPPPPWHYNGPRLLDDSERYSSNGAGRSVQALAFSQD
jgi:hypothetical protein